MPDDEALTIETMWVLAQQAGLALSDEELRDLMPGVARNRERAKVLEKWVSQDVEMAPASLLEGSEVRNGR